MGLFNVWPFRHKLHSNSQHLALFGFTLRRHLPILCLGIIFAVCTAALLPIAAVLLGKFTDASAQFAGGAIDSATLHDRMRRPLNGMLVVGACSFVTHAGMFTSWTIFGELQANSVRDDLFRSLLNKDLEWFEARESGVASLLTRLQTYQTISNILISLLTVTSQIRELQLSTSQPLGFVLSALVEGFANFGLSMYYSWKLTMVIIGGLPLCGLILHLISRGLQCRIALQTQHLTTATAIAGNAVDNISLVKCFSTQYLETQRYMSAVGRAATFALMQSRLHAIQTGIVGFFLFAMFMLGFWYGGKLVHDGGLTPGGVITAIWAAFMSMNAFQGVMPHISVLAKGHAAALALHQLIESVDRGERHRILVADGLRPELCEGHIDMHQISFAYLARPEQPVLQLPRVIFQSGRMTFLVGKSGSGKSTIANLLVRFYAPTSGTIFLDGHNVLDLDTAWLRNNITLVQQDTFLFNETIYTNIALGQRHRDRVTSSQIFECVQLASLEQTIAELPFGIDTRVGAKGRALSGGQSQRVALARARLRNTPVLILDESTSALDQVSRVTVLQRLRDWRAGMTTIVITHDVQQIQEHDFVYMLDNGTISRECLGSGLRPTNEWQASSVRRSSRGSAEDAPIQHVQRRIDHRWTKRPTHRRPSFEAKLDDLTNGQYLDVPNMLTRASHMTVLYSGPDTVRQPSYATARWSTFPNNPNHYQDPMTFPSSAEVLHGKATSIPLSTISGRAKRISALSVNRMAGDKPMPSPRLLESSGQSYRAKFGGPKFEKLGGGAATQMSLQKIFSTVWPSLGSVHRVWLVSGIIATGARSALPSVFSYGIVKILETFYLQADYETVVSKWTLVLLGVAIADGALAFAVSFLMDVAARSWVDRLRGVAVERVLQQSKSWFELDEHSTARLCAILDHSAEDMRHLLGRYTSLVISVVVMMAVALIWAFVLCWKITLVGLAAVPAIFGLAVALDVVSTRLEAKANVAADNICDVFVETFTDIRTVRSLTLESYLHRKYKAVVTSAFRAGQRRAIYIGVLFGITESTMHFFAAGIFGYLTYLMATYEWSPNPIWAATTLLLLTSNRADVIISLLPQIAISAQGASRLLRLAALKPSEEHRNCTDASLAMNDSEEAIRLNDLTFCYPTRPLAPVLQQMSLSIPSGQCTAIVGRSGSGKSTIASLIVGLYNTETLNKGSPSIEIFGQDIRTINPALLRSTISIVPQDPVILPGTVWDNICYGLDPGTRLTSKQNVNWAATQAAIYDFILSLPNEYDTVIGEGGLGLSGGQAQRIVIARALVRRPQILILDEATSALDLECADTIRSSLRSLTQAGSGRSSVEAMTVVIVTHAPEMMRFADKVVVLEQGSVVEQGGFQELMSRRGALHAMLTHRVD